MAIQLPEPDFYTLAEVAERLEVSAGVLLRLGAENKVLIGYPLFFQMAYVVRPTQKAGCKGFEALSAEMLSAIGKIEGAAEAFDGIARFPVEGFALCNRDIKIAIGNGLDYFRLDFVEGITSMPKLPPDHHYVLLRPVSAVSFADLVIPTSEIHRLEHQRKAAEKAAADDVLGTKDKEKFQAMIAAMAQIIANKFPGYKNGDRPNAARIAEAMAATGITERRPDTMAKEISKALELFGK